MAVTKTRCAVLDCQRDAFSRGMCQGHYDRLRRSGNVGSASFKPLHRTARPCREPECGNPIGKSGARGWCYKHYVRWKVHGDPQKLGYHGNGVEGAAHHNWKGDQAGYAAIHDRIRRLRGTASNHRCVDCDCPAMDWSYTYQDPNELIAQWCGRPTPYSADPAFYVPRCKSCHKIHDLAMQGGDESGHRN